MSRMHRKGVNVCKVENGNFITSAIFQNVFLITYSLWYLLEVFVCTALTHFSGWQWFNLCLWHFRSTIYLDSKLHAYTHSEDRHDENRNDGLTKPFILDDTLKE